MKEWVRSRVWMWFSKGQYNDRHVCIEGIVDESPLLIDREQPWPKIESRRFRLGHLNGYSKPQKEGSFTFTIEWQVRYKPEEVPDPYDLAHPFYEENCERVEELISPSYRKQIEAVTAVNVRSKSQGGFEFEVSFTPLRGEHYTDAVVRIFIEIADRLGVPRRQVWEASMSFDQDAFVMVGGEWMLKREFFEKRIRAKFA